MRIEQGFQPASFVEGHPYTTDPALPGLLKRLFPPTVLQDVEADLIHFGDIVETRMSVLSQLVEPPRLVQYNQWGQRVDELQTSEGWRGLKALFHEEGIVGIFYERRNREFSRAHGFAKILLAIGDSQVVCDIANGHIIRNDKNDTSYINQFKLSNEHDRWLCPGQQRAGGSDVSLTETLASPVPETASTTPSHYGQKYTLDRFKWFSSATDSNFALALARTGSQADGSRALSLFLVPLRLPMFREPGAPRPPSTSNNVFVHRLKNKVGTQALPTAELSLEGAEGYLIGEPGQGVKLITPVLNITRLHSATTSVGSLRRCLAIVTAYSRVRAIKGGAQLLKDTPLHVAELAKVSVLYRALVHMLFGTISLLGKTECGVAHEEEALRLRLLTPAIKAFAAEKACTAMEECMAALGGAGYMSENEIGRAVKKSTALKAFISAALSDLVAVYAVPMPPLAPALRSSFFVTSRRVCVFLSTLYGHSTHKKKLVAQMRTFL
ncbi:predicted protein [Postia placenta Mad-698-R]|nr:predicted protein [Postia placenta Mad-698-R]